MNVMSGTTSHSERVTRRVAPKVWPLGHNIADYFFVAGCDDGEVAEAAEEIANGNSEALLHLEAHVLDRFPLEDRPLVDGTAGQFPLAAPIFCFPQGFNATWDGRSAPPKDPEVAGQHSQMSRRKGCFFTFVLTDGDGTRSYGSVLQFLEVYNFTFPNQENPSAEPLKLVVKVPKILCILSQYGYFSVYQKYLRFLLRTYYKKVSLVPVPSDSHKVKIGKFTWPPPIESEIYRFVLGCKLPERGYGISYPLGGELSPIKYCPSIGPPAGFPDVDDECFQILFQCLSAENLVFVVCSILLEQRILLHSEDLNVLHKCAEALISLLFPLCWQHVYVPLLPVQLLEYLSAPVPFIMGVHTSALASHEGIESLPSSVVVHLDYNNVAPPMEVLLPGESGPVLKCSSLPELAREVRLKLISKIVAEVPQWQTSRLAHANTGTRLGAVDSLDDITPNLKPTSPLERPRSKSNSKKLLSNLALAAVEQNNLVSVTFGPGPVGISLQSTKWIHVGDIFNSVGAAMVRGFTSSTDGSSGNVSESPKALRDEASGDDEILGESSHSKSLITVGSVLVSINGNPTASATFTETMHTLRFSPRPMTLQFLVAPSRQGTVEGNLDKSDRLSDMSETMSNQSSRERSSTPFSGNTSSRWIDKVRSAFLDLMFQLFSGGIKEQQSFAGRMMSSFRTTSNKRISLNANRTPSSPKSPKLRRQIRCAADYRTFLPRPTGNANTDQKAFTVMKRNFVKSHPKGMQDFMAVFVETQAFSNYIADAAMLKFYGHGATPSKQDKDVRVNSSLSYEREADIEILNQCIQTADVSEGMLLDALCRYDGEQPSTMTAAPDPLEMCGVRKAFEAVRSHEKAVSESGGLEEKTSHLRAYVFDALADANHINNLENETDLSEGTDVSEGVRKSENLDTEGGLQVSSEDKDSSSLAASSIALEQTSKKSPVQTRKPDWVRRTSQMVVMLNSDLNLSKISNTLGNLSDLDESSEDSDSSIYNNNEVDSSVTHANDHEGLNQNTLLRTRQRAGTKVDSSVTPRTSISRRRRSFQGRVKSQHALDRIRTVSAARTVDRRSIALSFASAASSNSSLQSITEVYPSKAGGRRRASSESDRDICRPDGMASNVPSQLPINKRHLSQMIVNLDELDVTRNASSSVSLARLPELSHAHEDDLVDTEDTKFLSGHIDSVAMMQKSPGTTPNRTPTSSVDL